MRIWPGPIVFCIKWGFLDAAGHVSMRDPNNPNHYFISRWIASDSVTPADIIEMDLDSVPVGSNRTDLYQERYIHGEIYKARPDVNAVVHSHTAELIMFGASCRHRAPAPDHEWRNLHRRWPAGI